MLKVQEIRELIKLIDQSSIDEFVYEYEGSKVKMKKQMNTVARHVEVVPEIVTEPVKEVIPQTTAAVTEAPAPAQNQENVQEKQVENVEDLHKITSPMVGTFYESSSPDADPYVKIGDKVKKDSIVCIVEAMKLFNEIEAEIDGEIVEILVEDGQLVEYNQPLFLVKK
ncbi:acetyl-CoA carboxylase biotin carboxyl carrier protein [Bacillus spongiae]|uniref:Biotin carboxyl carrier protein of acetyl-CoA carboxylase n=1 Tax=Bacillus spongiae TaxID=2683610 RepID=A0ABU8HFS0_9BACI